MQLRRVTEIDLHHPLPVMGCVRGQCGATVSQPAAVPGVAAAKRPLTFRRANRRTTYLPLIARMRRRAGRRGGPGRRSGAPRVRWGVDPQPLQVSVMAPRGTASGRGTSQQRPGWRRRRLPAHLIGLDVVGRVAGPAAPAVGRAALRPPARAVAAATPSAGRRRIRARRAGRLLEAGCARFAHSVRDRLTSRGLTGSGFQPAMIRAHSRASAMSVTPGNSRRSSTAADSSPPLFERGADGGGLGFGDGEHRPSIARIATGKRQAAVGSNFRRSRSPAALR